MTKHLRATLTDGSTHIVSEILDAQDAMNAIADGHDQEELTVAGDWLRTYARRRIRKSAIVILELVDEDALTLGERQGIPQPEPEPEPVSEEERRKRELLERAERRAEGDLDDV